MSIKPRLKRPEDERRAVQLAGLLGRRFAQSLPALQPST